MHSVTFMCGCRYQSTDSNVGSGASNTVSNADSGASNTCNSNGSCKKWHFSENHLLSFENV